jgi:hypothetical protein
VQIGDVQLPYLVDPIEDPVAAVTPDEPVEPEEPELVEAAPA